jgi:hypothetical protein
MKRRPSTLREWVILLFAAAGLGLLPWTIWLAGTLRPTHEAPHWDIAWSVFDGALALLFMLAAFAAWRRSPWVGVAAGALGTLLITDAWFDVILSSDNDELRTALFLAAVAELPAAAVCFWIAYRTEHFLSRVVGSHLAAARKGPAESNLIGVLEVPPDGEAAREARHPDAAA